MGEVYQARDTTLDRDVALKVLPEAFTADPDRLARFQREAKVLASLNHPNIGAIYGLEAAGDTQALVLELIEGPTLADRIAEGPMPVDEALTIATQIADALEVAHERGIIHRDLKPANVKVKADGTVKVLDFGLAKAVTTEISGVRVADTSTTSAPTPTTQIGTVVGTASYMSPEQARGKLVDRRSDVWAFGVVLYEMLTGKRAFQGDDMSLTLARLLEGEPAWEELPNTTPPRVTNVLQRCLEKDPRQRIHDVADVRLAIEGAFETTESGVVSTDLNSSRPLRAVVVAALLLVPVTALTTWITTRSGPSTNGLFSTVVALPSSEKLSEIGASTPMAISPDGSRLVYASALGGRSQLFVRELDQFEATPIPGTEGAHGPFFSPDGESIGFFLDVSLQRISLEGGAPQLICDVPEVSVGASWGADGIILFAAGSVGLARVSASGGDPEFLTSPRMDEGEVRHSWPEFLPGGDSVLFTVETGDGPRLGVLSVAARTWKTLALGEASQGHYLSTGQLVFAQSGELLVVDFDLDELEADGSPISVLDGVYTPPRLGGLRLAHFSVSASGGMVYAPGESTLAENSLVLVDRDGQFTTLLEGRGTFRYPRFSPNGRRIAVDVRSDTGDRDVWIFERERGTLTRLTFEGTNRNPIWSPDGLQITFSSDRDGTLDIHSKPSDGSGDAESLLTREGLQMPGSWASGGARLAFYELDRRTARDILVLSNQGDSVPFIATPFNERSPKFSPDGRWLAYVSNESGRDEVCIQEFGGSGAKWQISTDGGTEPVWTADGQELVYRTGAEIMAVSVQAEAALIVGDPQVLFEDDYDVEPDRHQNYDVSSDGQELVMVRSDDLAPTQLRVVLNWFEGLQERVPVP